ncbi:SDR family oxidoreductase [Sphingomonas sp. HMP9]|uniref:SDR family NAD(P)-dependent oxidoreductase n=1 Tax=Sphingomonas sp. HMP9 TaxID=1517554 RepID=UPI0018D832E5
MRAALAPMREVGKGSIVNISSMWGVGGVAAYQASKGAVRTMTKNAAVYAKDGVRVNSVRPGIIRTPLIEHQDAALTDGIVQNTPLGRLGELQEIANAVCFYRVISPPTSRASSCSSMANLLRNERPRSASCLLDARRRRIPGFSNRDQLLSVPRSCRSRRARRLARHQAQGQAPSGEDKCLVMLNQKVTL